MKDSPNKITIDCIHCKYGKVSIPVDSTKVEEAEGSCNSCGAIHVAKTKLSYEIRFIGKFK